jgi:hypothetical protein
VPAESKADRIEQSATCNLSSLCPGIQTATHEEGEELMRTRFWECSFLIKPHGGALLALVATISCGDAQSTSPPGTPGKAAGAGAPPSIAVQSLAIPPNAPTDIHLRAQPFALCSLGAVGEPPRPGFVVADHEGVVHLTVTAERPDASDFSLDCELGGAGGTRVSYPVTLSATTDASALEASQRVMAPLAESRLGLPRPPLQNDPMSYDAGWLLEHGYGRRPDPIAAPDAYRKWADRAAVAGRVAPSVSVPTVFKAGANEDAFMSNEWAGVINTAPGSGNHFNDAFGTYQIPLVWLDFTSDSYASTWVGLGGDSSDPLWQAGTTSHAHSVCPSGCWAIQGSQAWYEAWPAQTAQFLSLPVYTGLTIQAEAWVCDPSNGYADVDPEAPNAYLCYCINDTCQAVGTAASLLGSTNVLFSAEAVTEAPLINGVRSLLADFAPITFTEPWVCISNPSWQPGFNGCEDLAAAWNPYSVHAESMYDSSFGYQLASGCVSNSGVCDDSGVDVLMTWRTSH